MGCQMKRSTSQQIENEALKKYLAQQGNAAFFQLDKDWTEQSPEFGGSD